VQLRFRHRITLLVALAAFGLVAATSVTLVLGRRSERQLSRIETRYVPLLELDYRLSRLLANIRKALEDAASAAEESRLVDADRLTTELIEGIESGSDAIANNGGNPPMLVRELRAYYETARGVSQAMIEGTAASALISQIEKMRSSQLAFEASLNAATRPDRQRLAASFKVARSSQRQALVGYIIVAIAVLALMAAVSYRMIRRLNRSLQAVSAGVERLARGEFGEEIVVESGDEIGDLAREANRTALRLREFRDELEAGNAELARISRYKSEFLANMSHELRTPLNSIMILSKVLSENEGKNLTAKQLEYASLVNRSGDELLSLINEVLDLAKIESGRQTVECAWVPTMDIHEYIRRMFPPLAAQKKLAFELEVADDVPEQVRTDRSRLNQIVKNLVANAIKFTERGEVRVRVYRPSPSEHPDIPDPFAICVADTGIGIAADKLGHIFEAFTQADSGTSRRFGGTGLGLAIAKQLAGLLGGELRVDSTLGQGSTFTAILPVGGPAGDDEGAAPPPTSLPSVSSAPEPVAAVIRAPAAAAPTDAAGLEGQVALLVDADMRTVYSLSSWFNDNGMTVVAAADGGEALEVVTRDEQLSVALVDVTPGPDALELMRRIRAGERPRDIPIIALTTKATPEERARCIEAGASEVLTKPVDIEALQATLSSLLRPARRDQEA
jgi:signal transduction histidine kinase/CheY-like chemotaxis protein